MVAIVASACSPPLGTAGTLYVTNEISGDLSVIDIGIGRVVATIPLGKRPRGLRASPDGTRLYVALSGSPIAGPGVDESKLPPADKHADGIGIVDLASRHLLKVLPGGSDPEQVDVSLDGRLLFVANEDVVQVSVIDAVSGEIVAALKVGGEPEGVNLRPDGQEVYVTSENDNAVFVIDAKAPRVLRTIVVGPRPRSTTFLRDSSRAFVPSENGGTVSVIDTAAYKFLGTSENAVKTQIWIAICTYVLIAIAKKRLQLDRHSLYEILQILSLALFEQVPIHQLLTPPASDADPDFEPIQLALL